MRSRLDRRTGGDGGCVGGGGVSVVVVVVVVVVVAVVVVGGASVSGIDGGGCTNVPRRSKIPISGFYYALAHP